MAGSRTLTVNATARKNTANVAAINAVKVEWGGATGTKWYSDAARTIDSVSMEARVVEWGDITSSLGSGGSWSVRLADHDGAVRAAAAAEGISRHRVTLYQVWPDLAQSDWTVLWSGVTEARGSWREVDAVYMLACLGAEHELDGPLCTVVNRDDFPYAPEDAFGRPLPVVYGKRRGVAPAWVEGGGPETKTTTRLSQAGSYVYVADATEFPESSAESPIRVWIEREMVEGYFDAGETNKFVVTDRSIELWSGTATWEADSYNHLHVTGLTGEVHGYWTGFSVAMQIADSYDLEGVPSYTGPVQCRTIVKHTVSGADEDIWFRPDLSDGRGNMPWCEAEYMVYNGFRPWRPPQTYIGSEHAVSIRTHRQTHRRGGTFRYAGSAGACTFIVNDRPSHAVSRVYVESGDAKILLPTGCYTVNLNDPQFADEVGGNCTTITFRMPPEYIRWTESQVRELAWLQRFDEPESQLMRWQTINKRMQANNGVFCDVEGPTDDYDTVLEHPADIIADIAERAGLSAGRIVSASITAAKAAKPDYRAAFVLAQENARAGDILHELARQCECAIDWTEGNLRLVALTNALDEAPLALTVAAANRKLDGYELSQEGIQALTTQMIGTYRDCEDAERRISLRAETAMAAVGLLSETFDCWAYNHPNPVSAVCSFWLYRQRYPLDTETVDGFLNYLDVLPGDVVSIGGNLGWVDEVRAHPGSRGDDIDVITLVISVPPAEWYDEGWSYPSAAYTDPAEPSSAEEDADEPDNRRPPGPSSDAPEDVAGTIWQVTAVDYEAMTCTVRAVANAEGDLDAETEQSGVPFPGDARVLIGDWGTLGTTQDQESMFIPIDILPVAVTATEDMSADETLYTVSLDGTAVTVQVYRPTGIFVANTERGFLARSLGPAGYMFMPHSRRLTWQVTAVDYDNKQCTVKALLDVAGTLIEATEQIVKYAPGVRPLVGDRGLLASTADGTAFFLPSDFLPAQGSASQAMGADGTNYPVAVEGVAGTINAHRLPNVPVKSGDPVMVGRKFVDADTNAIFVAMPMQYYSRVSSADTGIDFLFGKIVKAGGIFIEILNPGADEDLEIGTPVVTQGTDISVTGGTSAADPYVVSYTGAGGGGEDIYVKVNMYGTAGFLAEKLAEGTKIFLDSSTNEVVEIGTPEVTAGDGIAVSGGSAADDPYIIEAAYAYSVTVQTVDYAQALTLVGDVASPGNYKYYGTSAAGGRGWQALTEITVVTGVQLSGATLQIKTRTAYVSDPSAESGWATVMTFDEFACP